MTRTTPVAPAAPIEERSHVVWVLEQALAEQRAHLTVGGELHALAVPPDRQLAHDLLGHLPFHLDWVAHLDPPATSHADGSHTITGRVGQIHAVTCNYRRSPDSGGWQPMRWAARTRLVDSTCSPDPARSVWPPSGNPVLIGFLLTLLDDDHDHQPC